MVLFKDNKGITLAVLVVTIVVLLILAGITISNITGGDGILSQAQRKKDAATIQKEKTILGNAVMTASNKTKLGDLTEDNLRDALSNKNVDIVKSGGLYKITFKDTNNLYKMNENGEYFYWENMQPTNIYAKLYDDGILIFSSKEDTSYKDYFTEITTEPELIGTYTNYSYNKSKIKEVIFYDKIAPSNLAHMFKDCSNLLEIKNIENLHTENATSMANMFDGCSKLKEIDISNFDTSKVTNMQTMFRNCKNLSRLNLNYFDTHNVTSMTYMFYNCSGLTSLDVSYLDTQNVQDMGNMFYGCSNILSLNVSKFNTKNVKNFSGFFSGCSKIQNLNIKNFNTENVTSMANMFDGCNNLKEIDISNFDTSKVTNMQTMFRKCYNLKNISITNFNTDKVETMEYMFSRLFTINYSRFK